MKTYSEQSRNLAANVVLEAAVAEAVALLKARPLDQRGAVWLPSVGPTTVTHRYPGDSLDHAESILRTAVETAELLLSGATS